MWPPINPAPPVTKNLAKEGPPEQYIESDARWLLVRSHRLAIALHPAVSTLGHPGKKLFRPLSFLSHGCAPRE